jgi:hypothetical protein
MRTIEVLRRLFALVWISGFATGVALDDPKGNTPEANSPEPDFTGKVIIITDKGNRHSSGIIEKVKVRRMGGRAFLVGKVADDGQGKKPVGVNVWIAVEEIGKIWEFESVEGARKFWSESSASASSSKPLEVESDVNEIQFRNFNIPIHIDPARQKMIDKVRLFVSEDSGKSWKHFRDYPPRETTARYSTSRDGLYWFAVQVVDRDGNKDPQDENLEAAMKVYVNSQRVVIKRKESPHQTTQDQ